MPSITIIISSSFLRDKNHTFFFPFSISPVHMYHMCHTEYHRLASHIPCSPILHSLCFSGLSFSFSSGRGEVAEIEGWEVGGRLDVGGSLSLNRILHT